MSELLAALPKKEDLASALPQDFSVDGFEGIDTETASLTSGIDANTPPDDGGVEIDIAIPADLSADSVTAKLQEPLSAMSSINADSLSNSIKSSALPVEVGTMDFDINTPMTAIGDALAPGGQAVTPTVDENTPGFDSQEALFQLKKLAAAGAATPMRLVNMYLKLFNTFIEKATDKERLVELVIESLEEIYLGQIVKLGKNLPYKVLEDLKAVTQSDFADKYEQLLNDIENSNTVDFDLITKARDEVLPLLADVKRANQTLTNFSGKKVEDLQRAIDNVLEFTGEGEVVLQQFFDSFESKVLSVLTAIKPPIEAIRDGAETINKFLNDTADKAEEVATKVSTTLTEKLETIDQFLSGDLTDKINEINEQIDSFLGEVSEKADDAVGTVKGGLASVTDGLEEFFEKVNELKAKLERSVEGFATKVDTETEEAFKLAEQKIRALLDKITEVLNSPSVKDALAKTKEGIEKFKKVMEEVSLQPVFDVVVTKTGEIEVKIQAIKVEELGVPQKTALKLGAKVIKEVKVDEIIKPELLAIFKELRDPIAALIEELKQGVLQINQLIDEFAPGTIVRNLIENAGPYKDFIQLLEKYKPSFLLQPLKDANEKLTGLVDKLDPNILIDKLQKLFEELYQLIEALSPDKLNKMILGAVSTVTTELKDIKDTKLDQIIDTVKQTISLKKLLEGTGIEDIADAEIWDLLKYYLGGEFLDKITEALTYVENEIAARVKEIQFDHQEEELAKMNELVDLQSTWTKTKMRNALNEVKTNLEGQAAKITELESRRKKLLIDRSDVPEYKDVLAKLDLQNYLALPATVNSIIDQETQITDGLKVFAQPLKDNKSKLGKVDKSSLEQAAPNVFKYQLSDPINKIIGNIQAELEVFKDAVESIRKIVETLTELPAKMDANVAKVLDAAVDGIKKVLESTIAAINQATSVLTGAITDTYNTVISTLDKFSPYGLLNSFAETDFEQGGIDTFRTLLKSPNEEISIFLSNKLTSEQQEILAVDNANWIKVVLEAVNASIFDEKLNEKKSVAKTAIEQKIAGLESDENADVNILIKYEALLRQLNKISDVKSKQHKIRLNRVILEAMYPDAINMSLQSLHPFIVEQVSRLYPEELVQQLDDIYLGIVDRVKGLPERLIQKPLDEKFEELKKMFYEHFDIEGIFKVLQVKLDGLDEDLELGLDRVSFSFNHLIDTLDTRLAE